MYWDSKSPHLTIESQLNQPGVTTLGALPSKGVIEPVLFYEAVTGVNYLEILRDVVIPQLQNKANFDEMYIIIIVRIIIEHLL